MDTPFEIQLEKLYQQIGETIVEMIPEEWEKVYLYGEVGDGYFVPGLIRKIRNTENFWKHI